MNSDNDFLRDYFSTHWGGSEARLEQYLYTGYGLATKIKPGERVLDVGCGTNPLKTLIPNLHGIDITDIGCDEVIAIEDFKTEEKFDVALALGSINFGSIDKIRSQIKAVDEALTDNGRIYWRCNPGNHDHNNNKVNEVEFFPWTLGYHLLLANEFGYEVTDFYREPTRKIRYFAKWVKRQSDL
jgi:hypothetical protein